MSWVGVWTHGKGLDHSFIRLTCIILAHSLLSSHVPHVPLVSYGRLQLDLPDLYELVCMTTTMKSSSVIHNSMHCCHILSVSHSSVSWWQLLSNNAQFCHEISWPCSRDSKGICLLGLTEDSMYSLYLPQRALVPQSCQSHTRNGILLTTYPIWKLPSPR